MASLAEFVEESPSSAEQRSEPIQKRPHIEFGSAPASEHPLEFTYTLSYFKRPAGKFNPEEYSDHVQPIAVFGTVEQFWRVYNEVTRVSEIKSKIDFHLFKYGIKPVWEDEANRNGGKWIVRLKKGVASRIWENLILAMIGEQFMVGEEICGAVCSVRNQEDIVSLWNRTANEAGITNRIRDTMRRVLNLPPNTLLEYKRHDDCLRCELRVEGVPYVALGNSGNKKDAMTNAARDMCQHLVRSGLMDAGELPAFEASQIEGSQPAAGQWAAAGGGGQFAQAQQRGYDEGGQQGDNWAGEQQWGTHGWLDMDYLERAEAL